MSKKDPDIGCVPSTFYYTFCATYVVVPVLSALMGIHAKPDKKFLEAEGPIVILGSHPSYLDPFVVMRLTKGRKVNFAAGEFLFRNKIWGKLFREAGIIPSKQFARDTTAVRAMFKVLNRGGVLTIFPEATRFIDGKSGKFDDGVARLIKKSGASLFFMDSRGAYLTYPRWSESFLRIGRIDAKFKTFVPAEQIKKMSIEEIYELMQREIDYNENDHSRETHPSHRNRNLAAGLQNVAYACPKCGREFTMRFRGGDTIVCENCSNTIRYLKSGLLEGAGKDDVTFDDLHKYTEWEKELTQKQTEDPNFVLETECKLFRPYDEVDFADVGSGTLTVTRDKIVYRGGICDAADGIVYHKKKIRRAWRKKSIDGISKETVLEFDIASMKGIIAKIGRNVEIYDKNNTLYRFGTEPQMAFKIHQLVSVLGKFGSED